MWKIVKYSSTLSVENEGLTLSIAYTNMCAFRIYCDGCNSAFHWNAISISRLVGCNIPEAKEILGVDCYEEVCHAGLIIHGYVD